MADNPNPKMGVLVAALPSGMVLLQITRDDVALGHVEFEPGEGRKFLEAFERCLTMAESLAQADAAGATRR